MSAERRENAFWKRRNKSRVRTQESRLSVKMNGPTNLLLLPRSPRISKRKGRREERNINYEPFLTNLTISHAVSETIEDDIGCSC